MSQRPAIEALGDTALLLRFGTGIGVEANARVHAAAAALREDPHPALRELVPAYATLALLLGTPATAALRREVSDWALARLDAIEAADARPRAPIEIPVAYGGDHGPDLEALARERGLSPDEVVARHLAGDYRVAMLGFAPGFPYLIGLDPSLASPRLDDPRPRVAAGSVGIADGQTGIYPRPGPGGWRLVGRTPTRLFDPGRSPPALLRPGDRVRFVAIDAARFAALSRGGE